MGVYSEENYRYYRSLSDAELVAAYRAARRIAVLAGDYARVSRGILGERQAERWAAEDEGLVRMIREAAREDGRLALLED